jgi:myosin-5
VNLPSSHMRDGSIVMGNAFSNDNNEDGSSSLPPDDLIHMTHLHEPAMVECLRLRFQHDIIYTSTGPILLALNPFKRCNEWYGEDVMQRYYERGVRMRLGGGATGKALPPHVYGVADAAFRNMMYILDMSNSGEGSADQSILVSGESGAGKTVTTKFIMAYLASLSERQHPPSGTGVMDCNVSLVSGEKGSIEQQVLQSNPILESFGNARTIRNDNSSRFGKYISLEFSQKGVLLGASIHTYLLEKVRLVNQAPGERNYHIFYELLSGVQDSKERNLFFLDKLRQPTHYKMLTSSGTFDRRDKVRDKDTFRDLKKAMKTMGMHNKEQREILSVACAVMQFSNLEFVEHGDASALDSTNPSFASVAKLLGVTQDSLEKALCSCTIEVAREKVVKTLSVEQALKASEALIKATYGALFTFLVNRINGCIRAGSEQDDNAAAVESKAAYIGVLDIFGFETFLTNSFEQLCINYCNEALQQQFNRFVFKLEQQEYEREGIEWSFISFPDNQDVLDLIDERRTGILSILDEQCRLARCTDMTFTNAMVQSCKDHSRFESSILQQGAGKFTVEHYAGPVEYTTTNFIEKNKDELPQEGKELLSSSSNTFVQNLALVLSSPSSNGGNGAAPQLRRSSSSLARVSVGAQFSSQLRDLRERIEQTSPHYVRCLKTNDLLVPHNYDPRIIVDQLRCAGVLEAVRVSRVGFPQRYSHQLFVDRYQILALKEVKNAQKMRRNDLCNTVVASVSRQMLRFANASSPDSQTSGSSRTG